MYRIYIFLFCLLLIGCGGPKSVGEGAEQAVVTGVGYAIDDPGHLRYPISGKKIDKVFYFMNKPETMIQVQQYHNSLTRGKGSTTPPNNYNNLQPREVSPFRQ